jgi:hypothetical protein
MSRIGDRAEAVTGALLQIVREGQSEARTRAQFVDLLSDEFYDVARELINEGFRRDEPEEQPVLPAPTLQPKLKRIK